LGNVPPRAGTDDSVGFCGAAWISRDGHLVVDDREQSSEYSESEEQIHRRAWQRDDCTQEVVRSSRYFDQLFSGDDAGDRSREPFEGCGFFVEILVPVIGAADAREDVAQAHFGVIAWHRGAAHQRSSGAA
jgi:hypothetical protein